MNRVLLRFRDTDTTIDTIAEHEKNSYKFWLYLVGLVEKRC
jgi:hypothetical protein